MEDYVAVDEVEVLDQGGAGEDLGEGCVVDGPAEGEAVVVGVIDGVAGVEG